MFLELSGSKNLKKLKILPKAPKNLWQATPRLVLGF
jgi:hypothetical protein